MKMMSKRPEDRYASWELVLQRLQIPESTKSTGRNVRALVERAIERHQEAEQDRLQMEAGEKQRRELTALVEYCFVEITDAAHDTVEAFNRESEFVKLNTNQMLKNRLSIYAENGMGGELPTVEIKVEPVTYQHIQLPDGKTVKALGIVKAPSGRGFNLLLVSRGPDDLYGQWHTLYVAHHPIYGKEDDRLEPFPFSFDDLPREIPLINAAHIYQTTKGTFNPDLLIPLIEELL